MNVKKRLWEIVEVAKAGDNASRYFDISILILIFLNVIAVIFSSIKPINDAYETEFYIFELISVIVFTIEYLVRLWSCVISDVLKAFLR